MRNHALRDIDLDNSDHFGHFMVVIDRNNYIVIWSEYKDCIAPIPLAPNLSCGAINNKIFILITKQNNKKN